MKTKTILLALICTVFCLTANAQLKAKGNVYAAEMYEVYIKDYNPAGCAVWNRFELWEYYKNFWARVENGHTLEAVWISQCTRDTLATLTIHGNEHKKRVAQDITLDGSQYVIK